MTDLSERLGLERAKDVSFRAAGSFQHTAACIEADRRATVEAVARWLEARPSNSDDGTKIGDLCTVCDWYRIEGRPEREASDGE